MGIVRKAHNNGFTSISNTLAQDNSLSFEARGLLVYLLSKPDNWQAMTYDIEREGNIGRHKRQKLFKEIEEAGYCKRLTVHDAGGRFVTETLVYEEPLPLEERSVLRPDVSKNNQIDNKPRTEFPSSVEPSSVERATEKPSVYNKNELEKNELEKTEGVPRDFSIELFNTVREAFIDACGLKNKQFLIDSKFEEQVKGYAPQVIKESPVIKGEINIKQCLESLRNYYTGCYWMNGDRGKAIRDIPRYPSTLMAYWIQHDNYCVQNNAYCKSRI